MRRGRNDSRGNALGTPSNSSRSHSQGSAGAMLPPQYFTTSAISAQSQQSRTGSPSGSRIHLVGQPNYRYDNLNRNDIYKVRNSNVPDHLNRLVQGMGNKRNSPEPTPEQVEASDEFNNMDDGCDELDLLGYFDTSVRDRLHHPNLQVSKNVLVNSDWVPNTCPEFRLSQPKPDALYGYKLETFEKPHMLSLRDMHRSLSSNNHALILPFLVIEHKATGPANNGSLWEAENQCFGASAACVNIAGKLNEALKEASKYPGPVQRLDNAVFSIAMSNWAAKLYISWQSDMDFFSSRVGAFCLVDPESFIQFRRRVRNIIDWGMNQRLDHTRGCLDVLIEEKRLLASQNAKARSPPR